MRKLLCMVASVILPMVIMVGCKLNITPELYLSDLRDVVANDTTGLMTPMAMAIEIPST